MALSEVRNTTQRDPHCLMSGPIAASVTIYAGSLVVMDTSGYFRPGRASTTDVAIGCARETYDNASGAAAALTVTCDVGVFHWDNSADGDAITLAAHKGSIVYVVDDDQVAATSNSNARIPAGTVVDVDSTGVWVATGAAAGAGVKGRYAGTFTSTFTVGTNCTGAGTCVGKFIRQDDIVSVSIFAADVVCTAGAPTASVFDLSIPITSAFAAATDFIGTVTGQNVASGIATADTTNDRIDVNFSCTSAASNDVVVNGHFQIL
jgi:hypothetical protein